MQVKILPVFQEVTFHSHFDKFPYFFFTIFRQQWASFMWRGRRSTREWFSSWRMQNLKNFCHYICWMGRRYKIHRWSIFYSLVRKHFDVHKKDFIILYLNSRLDIFARAPIIHSVNYDLLLEKNVWQKLIVQYMMCESIFVAYIFPSLSICASLFASKQNYIGTSIKIDVIRCNLIELSCNWFTITYLLT